MPKPGSDAQRLCLFGGTFDPIHTAHLRIADEARIRFSLDRVLFIPAGTPPHKESSGLAPYEKRFEMVAIACEAYPAFEPSRLEAGAGKSYSIDTVRKVRGEIGPDAPLSFLIGADAFDEIESWKEWQRLLELTEFIVVTRPGGTYRVPPGARVHKLDGLELPISSSSTRARIARGEPTPELLPAVRAYIEAEGLYGSSKIDSTVLP